MGLRRDGHALPVSDAAAAPRPGRRRRTAGMVAAWYASNIGVVLLNKYLLSVHGFRFPVFLTACHMAACVLLSSLAAAAAAAAPPPRRSRGQLARVAVLGAAFCGSVVAANVSLRYLPVSFSSAVGSTTVFFTAVLAYAVAARREACATYAALLPVVAGVVITTGGEPSFHLFGFIMSVVGTALRALKTVLQGILLSSEEEKLNSMDLLRYMAPVALLLLVPATMIMERDALGVAATLAREDPNFIWIMLCNSSLAYFVNLTNFLVTKHTSPLTLQVLGNARGAVVVVVSILIFRNPVTFMGMLGYGITVTGVVLYGEAKKRNK
ncbi:hypothetical protein ACP4OV_016536 [Aristida adscensionis]